VKHDMVCASLNFATEQGCGSLQSSQPTAGASGATAERHNPEVTTGSQIQVKGALARRPCGTQQWFPNKDESDKQAVFNGMAASAAWACGSAQQARRAASRRLFS